MDNLIFLSPIVNTFLSYFRAHAGQTDNPLILRSCADFSKKIFCQVGGATPK